MNEIKKRYLLPDVEKILMDNDISLALESPSGDPEPFAYQEPVNDSHLA